MSNFSEAVAGFDLPAEIARDWDASQLKPKVSAVTGIVNKTLRQVHPLTGHEVPFLKKHSPGAIKMMLPSPTQFPAIAFKRGTTDKIYKHHSDLLCDIVEIERVSRNAGCP